MKQKSVTDSVRITFLKKTVRRGTTRLVNWLLINRFFFTKNISIAPINISVELCLVCFSFIPIVLFINVNNVNACSQETKEVAKL
jgi:hypothetical protein